MDARVAIRPVQEQDLDALVELAEARRWEYATYQPLFWRPASDALARQRTHLAGLLGDQDVLARVAVTNAAVVGFAIGRLTPAPPMYDPGGATCVVDDFTFVDPDSWLTVGVDLLRAVSDAARNRGAVQVVVVTAHRDAAKRAALAAVGLGIASEWWTGPSTPADPTRSASPARRSASGHGRAVPRLRKPTARMSVRKPLAPPASPDGDRLLGSWAPGG